MTDGGEPRPASNTAASAAPPPSNWTASRVIGIVFASIGGLIGLALLVGGIAVLAAYAFGRDDDGYFKTDRQRLESATYAIITEDIAERTGGLKARVASVSGVTLAGSNSSRFAVPK